jgi:hypothetical protein
MTREESIKTAAGNIERQIVLDYGEPLNEETSRRILHELEKIYAIGQIHAIVSEGLDKETIIKDLLKGD